jgi:4-alpha-glucanotransferase
MIASHLERCDALRIDHVMALHRLYYVPEGAEATEGVYVRQPAEELWACLTLESRRHKAVIIGENLGVVPREVNRAMHAHGALGMSVAAFEMGDDRAPLPRPTAHQAGCINTHDMPTFPAFWSGEDVDLHLRVGVVDEDRAHGERHGRSHLRARLRRAFGLSEDVSPEEDTERVLMRLLEHLARSDARAVLVGLEDLLGERLPQNIPGVGDYPNWRRRARRTVEEITGDPSLGEAVERLAAARRGGDEAGPADRMEARS